MVEVDEVDVTYMWAGELLNFAALDTAIPGATGISLVCLEVTKRMIPATEVANNTTLKNTSTTACFLEPPAPLVAYSGGGADDFSGTSILAAAWVCGGIAESLDAMVLGMQICSARSC